MKISDLVQWKPHAHWPGYDGLGIIVEVNDIDFEDRAGKICWFVDVLDEGCSGSWYSSEDFEDNIVVLINESR